MKKVYSLLLSDSKSEQDLPIKDQANNSDSDDDKSSITTEEDVPELLSSYNVEEDAMPEAPFFTNILVYTHYLIMISFALLTSWLRNYGIFRIKYSEELETQKDFVSLDNKFETLFINSIYRMASDVVNRPIVSVPSTRMLVQNRITHDYGWTYESNGVREVLNMGSYNYLGFSNNSGICAESAVDSISKYGLAIGSTKHEFGNHILQREMENQVADFLGVDSAITFPMGFGTNSMNISAFVNDDCLVISDALNHSSICLGCKNSNTSIKRFKHNDAANLEKVIRKALSSGNQKKNGAKFKKILIIVEGIYSMEGTIVDLPRILEVKKKYKAYLFLDEAHSVGAMGPNGRGVVDYWGLNPKDIDIMMGTLTKSFAAAGGYIAGSKKTIDFLKANGVGSCYGAVYSPPVVAQIQSSLGIISGSDGTTIGRDKIKSLLRNSRYFRLRLKQMGFHVCGSHDSPVIPLMTYYISKVVAFGRESFEHNLGVVSVGYPATPLTKARTRFCMCADHTQEDLDEALEVIDRVGDITGTKYGKADYSTKIVY
uniref:Aminotran_1_2 domain-containing protein n=1 Tax=Rhabditophanes sp. KR3021 TaxID=114890 RepID=A0AC35UBW9_9BILA